MSDFLRRFRIAVFIMTPAIFAVALGCGRRKGEPAPAASAEPFSQHVGSARCAECHPEQTESFRLSPMGRSLQTVDADTNLSPSGFVDHRPEADFAARYSVELDQGQWRLSETLEMEGKPASTQTERLAIAVGSGNHGMTFLTEKPGGFLFQAPASWYRSLDGWELSPGYEIGDPQGFTRPVTYECLYCHSGGVRPIPGSVNGYRPGEIFIEPAISCERCHGAGGEHVRLHYGELEQGANLAGPHSGLVNPEKLTPDLAMDLCLQCHRSEGGGATVLRPGKDWHDFTPGTPLSETLARFEAENASDHSVGVHFSGKPTQLAASECFRQSQGAMHCLTCHTIHHRRGALQQRESYRQKCLDCHSQGCRLPETQRLSQQEDDDCAACHMPKVAPADIIHSQITDHRIRVVGDEPDSRTGVPSATTTLRSLDGRRHGADETRRNEGIAHYLYARHAADAQTHLWRATSLLQKAVEADPKDFEARMALGGSLAALGKTRLARRQYEQAASLRPDDVMAHSRLGFAALQSGDPRAAVAHFKTAFSVHPYHLETLLGLAQAYELLGDKEAAAGFFNRAAALNHRLAKPELE